MDGKQITYPAVLFLSIVSISFVSASAINSFSLDLIHRHHLPTYSQNKFIAPENRLLDRLESDILRVNALSAPRNASAPLSSGLAMENGYAEYVVTMKVGTPLKQVNLVLDSWSDLSWLQCQPCTNCYTQTTPIFDPNKSSSFSTLQCGDKRCKLLHRSDSSNCSSNSNACLYNQTYGEDWYSYGQLSTETLTFGDTAVEKVAIGCGHDNEGQYDKADGFFSVSRADMSFVTQTEGQFGKNFSYCLSSLTTDPASNSSSITFGEAMPKNAITTPLVHNPVYRNYYLGLTGISVASKLVAGFDESVFDIKKDGKGGVMIDLLTAFTWWTTPVHKAVSHAFRAALEDTHMTNPPYEGLDTCYDLSNRSVKVPKMELHFKGGANLKLPVDNYFILTDLNGTYCLAFASPRGYLNFSVMGNLAQESMQVNYDLNDNILGFTPDGCT